MVPDFVPSNRGGRGRSQRNWNVSSSFGVSSACTCALAWQLRTRTQLEDWQTICVVHTKQEIHTINHVTQFTKQHGSPTTIKILLKAGADLNARVCSWVFSTKTKSSWCFFYDVNDIFPLMADAGRKRIWCPALCLQCCWQVKPIYQYVALTQSCLLSFLKRIHNPLACTSEGFRILAQHGADLQYARSNDGQTPLHSLCSSENTTIDQMSLFR